VGRRWTWLAWSMLAVFIVIMVFWIILGVANGGFALYGPVAIPLAYTAFMVVGALIVAHRPGNTMGWLFSALGLLAAVMFLALEYAPFAYYTGMALAGRDPGRLVVGMGPVHTVWPHRHLHPAALSHRSAAVAPLASGRLAGSHGPGGGYGGGCP
jgi:hypothetical protein